VSGAARMRREIDSADVVRTERQSINLRDTAPGPLGPLPQHGVIVSARPFPIRRRDHCSMAQSGPLVVLDAGCIRKAGGAAGPTTTPSTSPERRPQAGPQECKPDDFRQNRSGTAGLGRCQIDMRGPGTAAGVSHKHLFAGLSSACGRLALVVNTFRRRRIPVLFLENQNCSSDSCRP
jgi:hypothetical protein